MVIYRVNGLNKFIFVCLILYSLDSMNHFVGKKNAVSQKKNQPFINHKKKTNRIRESSILNVKPNRIFAGSAYLLATKREYVLVVQALQWHPNVQWSVCG